MGLNSSPWQSATTPSIPYGVKPGPSSGTSSALVETTECPSSEVQTQGFGTGAGAGLGLGLNMPFPGMPTAYEDGGFNMSNGNDEESKISSRTFVRIRLVLSMARRSVLGLALAWTRCKCVSNGASRALWFWLPVCLVPWVDTV